jgi:transcriptional regulator with XRE-family HTH domain
VAKSESFAKTQKQVRATLGERIKELRSSLELSQSELAVGAGLRRALVSEIEQEKANPTLDSLARLAIALGVEVAELLVRSR